ncbi:MAG: exodeoxyribonuclease V subunit gamma [Clostridiales Family XIII bacterium]|nr:exodeoxyribonuclease V subunit gamma [Clostridiales Family XIII bacterium]
MFERVASALKERRVFLIVPEQSTLRAESDAFGYMNAPGFIDFDVLSMTSLGRRVLEDTGYRPVEAQSAATTADSGVVAETAESGLPGEGFASPAFISKYGKFMLLSRILYRRGKELRAFSHIRHSPDFVEKLNDMIAELKNHNITPEGLKDIAAEITSDSLLKRKIEDAALIYEGYERATGDEYMDQTDYQKLYTSKIGSASFVPDAEFWLSGFDYLSPTVADTVMELALHAASVNVVLTADAGCEYARQGDKRRFPKSDPLFTLTNGLAADLARRASESGVEARIEPIPSDAAPGYLRALAPEIAHIEKTLFTRPHTPFTQSVPPRDFGAASRATVDTAAQSAVSDSVASAAADSTARPPTLRLIAAANYYAEAETAAAEICGLVRDGLYAPDGGRDEIRYRDILVLCNDMTERGSIIGRVFRRYGLPVFMDRRRDVEHNPVIEYLLALPRIASSGRRYEDVFTLLKTGLTDITADEIDELENYVVTYGVRGKRWDKAFTFGLKRKYGDGHTKGEYEQEELDALNGARIKVASLIGGFEEGFKAGRTARARTEAFLTFLTERAQLPEMTERYAAELEGAGMLEYAAEMSGMWDVAREILGQMSTVLGDLDMSLNEYAEVLRAGLDSVRIGVLPTAVDQIVLGTMQRTRSGSAKAVFVLGANDGVLPASASDGALFSQDEVYRLADAGHNVARTEDTTHMEEELAIYRNFSKPRALLRVSYAASDSSGKNIRPSPVFERLCRLFPETPTEKDIGNISEKASPSRSGDPRRGVSVPFAERLVGIQHPDQALDRLSERMRAQVREESLGDVWAAVSDWYRVNRPNDFARVEAGLNFRGRRERVDAKFVEGLYWKVTSPSALERYSRCPFSWFMSYGLNLRERRVAGMDDMGIGDVYHSVLMRFGQELSSDGLSARDESSRWRTITDEEIDETARRLTSEEYAKRSAAEDVAIDAALAATETYRMERVSRTAALAARVLTRQIREGAVDAIYFESSFGENGDFPSLVPGQANRLRGGIRIEGRIDRVDVLDGGRARVVDYKSGTQAFSAPDATAGYQLQLMLYLQAVAEHYEPVGVFYFRIKEPRVEDDGDTDVAAAVSDSMKLDGAVVDDAPVLIAMGMNPAGKAKKGRMEKDEFDALRNTVSDLVENLVGDLMSGRIDADPKTAVKLKTTSYRNMKACDYCPYGGICNYDVTLT